jgi:RNA polymerase sigma factor (sigma-70 family)
VNTPKERRKRRLSSAETKDSFTPFAEAIAPRLLRTAGLLLGDRGSAEDATQATLLRVFRHWESITSSHSGYAASVLLNVCRDVLRERMRRIETPIGTAALELIPTSSPDLSERFEIEDALTKLPQVQREVIALRYLLDLSVSETATALKVPEGTVKSATSRALDRLRTVLTSYQEGVNNAH